jgi:hypothetical protein
LQELLASDHSLLIGASPELEGKLAACKKMHQEIAQYIDNKLDVEEMSGFILGYDELGNGYRFLDQDMESWGKLTDIVTRKRNGYFRDSKDGEKHLIPGEVMYLNKLHHMKLMLEFKDQAVSNYHSSKMGNYVGRVTGENVTADSLRRYLSKMSEVHLVSADSDQSSFVISSSKNAARGSYCISKEKIGYNPTTSLRAPYVGETTVNMVEDGIGGDDERKTLRAIAARASQLDLNPMEEFLLKETLLMKTNRGETMKEYSYLTLPQCFHYMYQFPHRLIDLKVQHTLIDHMFQRGLVREMLQKNPNFFVSFAPVLHRMCEWTRAKGELETELFFIEIAEKIRSQAYDLNISEASQIASVLPAYDKGKILGGFDANILEEKQKIFSIYTLSYFCHYPPNMDVDDWKYIIKAYAIYLNSPILTGHSGMVAMIKQEVLDHFLPDLTDYLNDGGSEHSEKRDAFLFSVAPASLDKANHHWKRLLLSID